MKLAVIFTGGTIGSGKSAEGITVRENGSDGLLHSVCGIQTVGQEICMFSQEQLTRLEEGFVQEKIQYVSKHPFTLLSENSTGLVLQRLANCIEEVLKQTDIEGILVTHGTDTLVYSAAAMGYLFAQSHIPIVFVSSNYILDDARANGWDNFRYGVAFISQRPSARGVYVSYRNEGDVPRIHRATEVISQQVYSDALFSVCGREYGHFEPMGDGCRLVCGEDGTAAQGTMMPRKDLEHPHLRVPTAERAPILQIYPCPGMKYPPIPQYVRAVLHHSYHAGTICGSTQDAENFFAEARKMEIPVFLCGVSPDMHYASMQRYTDYGIRVLPVASPVAMYMKLWLLLEADEDLVEWMPRRIAGEVDTV